MRRRIPLPPVLRPLRDPVLALLWAGQATSAIGDQLFSVALAWIAVQVMGPRAGYLTALQAACLLAVALFAGRWADQVAHRTLMVAADLFRAAVLCVVVATWLVSGAPPAWALVAAVVGLGAGQALFEPALQASLPALVEREATLPAANALLDTTERIARLMGPGIVGVLGAAIPLVHFVSVDVLTFLASAAAIAATIRLRALPFQPRSALEPVLRNLARGFAAMRGHALLRYALFASAPIAGIWYAILFLGVPLALADTAGGVRVYGWVLLGYGSTNLMTTLVMGGFAVPRRPAWVMFGGAVLLGAGLAAMGAALLLPAAWQPTGLFAAAAFGAVGGPMEDIPIAVLRQTRIARAEQAAAMRASLVATYLGILVALCAAPLVFARFGPAPCMGMGGLLVAAVGGAGWWRYARTEG